MSVFAHLTVAPNDPILGTAIAFRADTDPRKVNVGIGAYRTNDGKPHVLNVVRKVEQEIANDLNEFKEYAPVDGIAEVKVCTQKLLWGDHPIVKEGRVASAQALSGTGSLRVAAEFIRTYLPPVAHTIWLSDPTWGNHMAIFAKAGMTVERYPYWDAASRSLDIDGMTTALKKAQPGNVVLLHAVAHNPTGVDPTESQWREILQICREKRLFPIIDSAYQGFASGCLDHDAFAVRLFADAGLEFMVCQSFAKNMGLYGERFGMLHTVCKSASEAAAVISQQKLVIRAMYSSPPIHGAQLVVRICNNPENLAAWKVELKEMADRISSMRHALRSVLESKGTPGTWNHITDQIGMFSYTGLTVAQCERMIDTHHIYMLKNGRISLAGINESNVQYVANAIDDCVRNA